jgi:diguanylate cyclase (GGDEF)-like protein
MKRASDAARRVLIATGDEGSGHELREHCEGLGYQAVRVETGDEVWNEITHLKPDVLLLDVGLQHRDGMTVLKEFRENQGFNDVPVVLLADAGDLDSKIRGMELGADDYMTRPYKQLEIKTRVGSALMVREYRKRLMSVEAELSQLRSLDPVSGAGTATQLKASLDSELARARRYGRPASLLVMGIDNYDAHFGTLGQARMDDYVGRLARTIRQTLRGGDRLFRMEKEQFVLMLPETDLRGARLAAERLAKIAAGVSVSGRRGEKVEVILRFGGAVFPDESVHGGEELLARATESWRGLVGGPPDRRYFEIAS